MKRIKPFFATIIVFILSFSCISTVYALNETQATEVIIDIPYEFPITPDDEQWEEFDTKQDRLDICQIPDEILHSLSTKALLETVLQYPYLTDYYAFNDYKDAAETFMNDFNGFKELYAREDLTEVLLDAYQKVSVADDAEFMDSEEDSINDFFAVSNIEFLIGYDQLINDDYTAEEAERFDNLLENKMESRSNSDLYSENSEIYLNFIGKDNSSVPYASTTTTVKTPKGTKVIVSKTTSDLSSAEKDRINKRTDKLYPNATRIATATQKYNCHSYAWYQQSTNNPYWMNDPSAYWKDGSYKKFPDIRPREGFKAYYYNGNHSAIVYKIKVISGAQTFWYRSKWGTAGLYEHSLYDCPYSTGVRYYCKSAS